MMPEFVAETITVRQSLEMLDGPFRKFAEGVAEDRYALWLGSGISLGRVDGLKEIVMRIMEFLRSRISPDAPDCRFGQSFQSALDLANLSQNEEERVDLTRPFGDWPDADAIAGRLISRYAYLLDIPVDGEADDFLLWHGLDVVSTFARDDIEPDVEHLCIAILILEGVASDIASANWDGLIEKAVDTLTVGHAAITVVVRAEDLQEQELSANLFKFHGCAARANADEEKYRSCLIGRQSQINGWTTRPANAALVNRLIDVIATKPTLMMGLSAQDANIQTIFAAAEARLGWPWPGDRPSYVFSEDKLGADQQSLLRNVYVADYTPDKRQEIMEGALIRAYAKPLLVSLVLHVLCSKLRKLILLAPGALSARDRCELQLGVVAVRNLLAAGAEPDRLFFLQALIDRSSRAITIFRDGRTRYAQRPYNSLTSFPMQRLETDTSLPASGLREAAVATGLLGMGINLGLWTLEASEANQGEGVFRIATAGGATKTYLVTNSHVALHLHQNEELQDGEDAIVIHSLEKTLPQTRSAHRQRGRRGQPGLREVSIAELLERAETSADLLEALRMEIAL